MGWMTREAGNLILLPLCFCFCLCFVRALCLVSIPAKYDGFVYKGVLPAAEDHAIIIEAFMDPICSDSRDAWPPLKRVVSEYASHVSLILHPFPLPYHDNSFAACRALHIANGINSSTTYSLMESFFNYQAMYYNEPTKLMSKATIIEHLSKFIAGVIGESSLPFIKDGFEDSDSDSMARISFKYGCSRGVTGTPFFFVNGFALPGAGQALSYNQWRSIIDPLLPVGKLIAQEATSFVSF